MARPRYAEKENGRSEQEKILAQLTQKSGRIANIWKLWSHSPQTLETFMVFYKTLMKGSLDPKLRELAYVKSSLVNDCNYCAEAHKGSGRRVGVTDQQLGEIGNFQESAAFSPVEKPGSARRAEELTRTAKSSEDVITELKKTS